MPEGMEWESLPPKVLVDCAQLVKANSIEGNRKNDQTIIYTPASNLLVRRSSSLCFDIDAEAIMQKTGDMAVGQVSFKSDKKVS